MIGHTGLGKNSNMRLVMGDAKDKAAHPERFTLKASVCFKQGEAVINTEVWYGFEVLHESKYHQMPLESLLPEWHGHAIERIKNHYTTRPALYEVTVTPVLEEVEQACA